MHVTNSRVFNNNKKVARNCVQLNTEWNETRVNVNVSNLYTATGDNFCFVLCYALLGECVSVFFPFFFSYLSLYYRISFSKSGEFASRGMTVSFPVWFSGRDDFLRVSLL